MDFFDYPTFLTIFHLFGVIIGAGGAFASDFMFFSSIKDRKLSGTELRFLRVGSRMVWIGLIIILISGALIFATDVERYLASSKFLAKMSIVAIIAINGLIFHFWHIPHLHRHKGITFGKSPEFAKRSSSLMASGAISIVSWTAAFVLGVFRAVPYDYWVIMGIYALLVFAGIGLAIILKKKLLYS